MFARAGAASIKADPYRRKGKGMASTIRRARLRVVNDNVGLGGDFFLPQGDYDGSITGMTVRLHGHEKSQVAKVAIYLSEEFLQSVGFTPQPNSTRQGIEADFTPFYLKGDITEI